MTPSCGINGLRRYFFVLYAKIACGIQIFIGVRLRSCVVSTVKCNIIVQRHEDNYNPQKQEGKYQPF